MQHNTKQTRSAMARRRLVVVAAGALLVLAALVIPAVSSPMAGQGGTQAAPSPGGICRMVIGDPPVQSCGSVSL